MPERVKTIFFAGGGSGGHISPGLAIAERLHEMSPTCRCVFVCSQREIDRIMLEEAGETYVPIPATPPIVRPLAACRFLVNFHRSVTLVRQLLRERHADHVLALGGFVAAPVVRAAQKEGIASTLLNLDAPPGKANRWMAKRVDRVWSAIEIPTLPGFASEVVGHPVRRRALAPGDTPTCRERLGLDPATPTILVTGASQGATSINELMIELVKRHSAELADWQVLHLSGHGGEQAIRDAYRKAGVRARVEPFVHEIGLAWGAADLALSRAGANSVAEIAANAVPTIFLPYPFHRDRHQEHNAQPLVEVGGAKLVIDKIEPARNAEHLIGVLRTLLGSETTRNEMRRALQRHGATDAAMTIARRLLDLPEPQSSTEPPRAVS